MAQNIYRRDSRSNLLEIPPSRKEIVTIEDETKHGIMKFGQLRTVAQLLERGVGIEVRDWDTNFAKGIPGKNSFDVSSSLLKFGTGTIGDYSFASGLDTLASGDNSSAVGYNTTASGENSHAEGEETTASGVNSRASGNQTVSSGLNSNASGNETLASGVNSSASGYRTVSSGLNSNAGGNETTASGDNSHTEGSETTASGNNSHAEGNITLASGINSHAEGSETTASGINSHAEGQNSVASGENSSASGNSTIASNDDETVVGRYNDSSNTLRTFTVGVGVYDEKMDQTVRMNGFEVHVDGSVLAPELSMVKIDSERSLVTREFVQEKLTLENWSVDFTYSSGTIFRSDIPFDDVHANITGVFQGGIMLRPTKYTYLDDNGFKAVQIGNEVSLNEGDWLSLQLNRVYIKD